MFIFENRTWTAKLFQCFRIVEDEQKILAILKHLSYEALRALEVWWDIFSIFACVKTER